MILCPIQAVLCSQLYVQTFGASNVVLCCVYCEVGWCIHMVEQRLSLVPEGMPGEVVPGEVVPGEVVPGEGVPGEGVPGESAL